MPEAVISGNLENSLSIFSEHGLGALFAFVILIAAALMFWYLTKSHSSSITVMTEANKSIASDFKETVMDITTKGAEERHRTHEQTRQESRENREFLKSLMESVKKE